MSLWSNVKTWAKNLFKTDDDKDTYTDTVSNDVTQDTGKQTLNEQIANGGINQNININTNDGVNFDLLNETPTVSIDPSPTQTNPPQEIEDKEEENTFTKLSNFFSSLSSDYNSIKTDVHDWINDTIHSINRNKAVNDAYKKLEEMYAVGYDPDSRDVYYLDLNEDRGISDFDIGTYEGVKDKFEQLYLEADKKISEGGDVTQAWMDFYNDAKGLFRIRADDYYGSPFRSGIKRRSDMYTQDELNYLASTGKTRDKYRDGYEPTFGEFLDYVAMYSRNLQTANELGMVANEHTPNIEEFNLEAGTQSDWMSKERDIALKGIDEYLDPTRIVNPNAAQKAELTYSSTVLNDQLSRWYNIMAPIYRAEQEVLSKDKSTWSGYDRYILEQAEKARQMDKLFAENLNEVFRQTLLYGTDKNGDIINTPDMFEGGKSLNDLLTNGLREMAGEGDHRYAQHQSALDIAQNFANNALYIYRLDKDGPLKRAWNKIEYFFEPVGSTLGEGGQALWAFGMDATGSFSMGMLSDELTKSYMDQDATVFRLLETDDSNIKRTIKKYYLEATEYTPEVMGNLIPDVALYALTGPGALTTTARHINDISRTYKAVKAAEGASLLNKFRVITGLTRGEKAAEALGMSKNAYSTIINAAKTAPKIKNYQTIKTAAELLDRAVTQVGLGQFMDAQWSAYDTEPYSQSSFLMSLIGSIAFDAMPEVVRLATGRNWRHLLTGRYGDNIWSLARFMDSSPEATENVARMLRKGTGEIGFEELKAFVKNFGAIESAAKIAYNGLTEAEKQAIGAMTKEMMYNYVNQAFGANSTIGKRVRQILANKNTNIADAIKYMGKIPGDVELGPYVSTIRLKNGTRANIFAQGGEYSPKLDSAFNGGFDSRVRNGFTQEDLDKLSKIDGYSDIEKNKSKWFYEVTDDNGTKYYLTDSGLKHFGLNAESITLESLGVSLKEAENTREALMRIKGVDGVKISDEAVDYLAETGAYDEITLKVKEVLGC